MTRTAAKETAAAAAPSDAAVATSASDGEINDGTMRLAEELRPYVPQNTLPEDANPADLQLTICRKLRELLPSNKDLLHIAQDRNWIPTLLTWLNLHDRPAVQVESLLALTNIAELCAQQSYLQQAQQQTSAVAAAAQAAVSAVKGWNSSNPNSATAQAAADAMEKYAQNAASASSKFASAYPGFMSSSAAAAGAASAGSTTPAPGSVPFPPLSFSQTLSPEAVAAFDASLTSTIAGSLTAAAADSKAALTNGAPAAAPANTTIGDSPISSNNKWALPAPPLPATAGSAGAGGASAVAGSSLFPPNPAVLSGTVAATGAGGNLNGSNSAAAAAAAAQAAANSAAAAAAAAAGINFSSLAPPPGGAHSSVPSNAFLPPPTPVTAPNFPQQLSASSQHLLLRHADAIPTLISLLSSPNREVYEQAVWILGSIAAGDSPAAAAASGTGGSAAGGAGTAGGTGEKNADASSSSKSVSARDVILAAGIMSQLLRCLEAHPNNLSLQRIGSWTLSNLVDGIFQQSSTSSSASHGGKNPSSNKSSSNSSGSSSNNNNNGNNGNGNADYSSADEIDMGTLLPVLRRLLRSADSEVLGYTCWTLSHLCDGPSSHIAAVVTTPDKMPSGTPKGGLVPRLVELLMHPSWRVTKPALRTIGNIVCAECSDDNHSGNKDGSGEKSGSSSATTDYTEVILECDAVPRLRELVTHSNREIQKEACWTLSNIAAGTVDQIQAVIDSGAIPPLVQLVRDKKTDQEVRSEACWVVLNATSCGSDSQIEVLVDEGCVSVLGVLLSEASMVMMALEGLERVLQVEETREMIRREQIESGEIEDTEATRTPTLVSASLIEKARESHNSSAVTKRADRIWKQHFVSCALCKNSFSKHRTSDAKFCEECKCHVCCNCNCKIYHLDYQEELWAATEEKTEAKKNAKKSKNKKKKAKLKERKAKQQQGEPGEAEVPQSGNSSGQQQQGKRVASQSSEVSEKNKKEEGVGSTVKVEEDPATASNKTGNSKKKLQSTTKTSEPSNRNVKSPTPSFDDEDPDDTTNNDTDAQSNIDFVLYLQQTGSIIALAKLMDALECAGDDYDEELNDYERKMIREQQTLREQQAHQ